MLFQIYARPADKGENSIYESTESSRARFHSMIFFAARVRVIKSFEFVTTTRGATTTKKKKTKNSIISIEKIQKYC